MAYYQDISLQPSRNDGCANQLCSKVHLNDNFFEKFSLKNQFCLLAPDENESSIYSSNLDNKIKFLTRYIEEAPRKNQQTKEFAKDVSRKLFFFKEDVKLFIKHKRRFPFCQALHSLLVCYVEFEYDVLYNPDNFSLRYQKIVEKRVLYLLLNILYDTHGVTKKLVSNPVEASAMNSLYILKSVQHQYKKPKNVIENMMIKLLRKLNILDGISEMKSKNKTLNFDHLLQVSQVKKMNKYLQNRDCEESNVLEDDYNENVEKISLLKTEVIEEIDRKFDISYSSQNEECSIINLDSEEEEEEEDPTYSTNLSKNKEIENSRNNRLNSPRSKLNSFTTSDKCDIEKLNTNINNTLDTSFVNPNENFLSSISRVSWHNKLQNATNKSNSSHLTKKSKKELRVHDVSDNYNSGQSIFEDNEYENPLLKRELLLFNDADYMFSPSKFYDIALILRRHMDEAPKSMRYKMKFVQGIHRTIMYLYENACRYIEVNKQFLSSLELHMLLVSYVELEYEGLYNFLNYSEKYEEVVENRILQLLLTVLYDPKNGRDFGNNAADTSANSADTSAMNALYVLRSVNVNYKRCQPLIENIMKKLLRKLQVLDTVNQLRCKDDKVILENLLKFPQFQKIVEYLKSRDLCGMEELNTYEYEKDKITMVPALDVKCEPKQELSKNPPETLQDIVIDVDEEDDDCVIICDEPNTEEPNRRTEDVENEKAICKITSQIYESDISIDGMSDSQINHKLPSKDKIIESANLTKGPNMSGISCNIENEDDILNMYSSDEEDNCIEICEESILNCNFNLDDSNSNAKAISSDESLTHADIEIIDRSVALSEKPINLITNDPGKEEKSLEEVRDFNKDEISSSTCLQTSVLENNSRIEGHEDGLDGNNFEASCIENVNEPSKINVTHESATAEKETSHVVECSSNELCQPEINTVEETTSESVNGASLNSNEPYPTMNFGGSQQSVIVHIKTSQHDLNVSPSTSSQEYLNTDVEVGSSYNRIDFQIESEPDATSNNVTEELDSQSLVFETSNYEEVIADEENGSLRIIESQETYDTSCVVSNDVDVVDNVQTPLSIIESQETHDTSCVVSHDVDVVDDIQTPINNTPDMQSDLISDTSTNLNTQNNSLSIIESNETYENNHCVSRDVDAKVDDVQTHNNDACDLQSRLISDTSINFNTQDNSLDVLAQLASERPKISDSVDLLSKKKKRKGKKNKHKKSVTETRVTRSTVIKESLNLKMSDNINYIPSAFINLESLYTPPPNRVCDLISTDFIANEESADGMDTYAENQSTAYTENEMNMFSIKNPIFDEDTIEDDVAFVCHAKKTRLEEVTNKINEIEAEAKTNELSVEYLEENVLNELKACNSLDDIPMMVQASVICIKDHKLESYTLEAEIPTFYSEQIKQEIVIPIPKETNQKKDTSVVKLPIQSRPLKKKKFRYIEVNKYFVKLRPKRLTDRVSNEHDKSLLKKEIDSFKVSKELPSTKDDFSISQHLEKTVPKGELERLADVSLKKNLAVDLKRSNFEPLENVPNEVSANKNVKSAANDEICPDARTLLSDIVITPPDNKEVLCEEGRIDTMFECAEKQTFTNVSVESKNNLEKPEIAQCDQHVTEKEIAITEDYGGQTSASAVSQLETSNNEKVLHPDDKEITKNVELDSANVSENVETVMDEKESLTNPLETSSTEKVVVGEEIAKDLDSANVCENVKIATDKEVLTNPQETSSNEKIMRSNDEEITKNINQDSANVCEEFEIAIDEKESSTNLPETFSNEKREPSNDEEITKKIDLDSANVYEDVEIAIDEEESSTNLPETSSNEQREPSNDEGISKNIDQDSANVCEDVEIAIDEEVSLTNLPETSSNEQREPPNDEGITKNIDQDSANVCEDVEIAIDEEVSLTNLPETSSNEQREPSNDEGITKNIDQDSANVCEDVEIAIDEEESSTNLPETSSNEQREPSNDEGITKKIVLDSANVCEDVEIAIDEEESSTNLPETSSNEQREPSNDEGITKKIDLDSANVCEDVEIAIDEEEFSTNLPETSSNEKRETSNVEEITKNIDLYPINVCENVEIAMVKEGTLTDQLETCNDEKVLHANDEEIIKNIELESVQLCGDAVEVALDKEESLPDRLGTSSDENSSQNIEIESTQFSEDVEIALDEKESLADRPETSSDEKISQNIEIESAQFSEDVEISLDEKESLADRPEMSSDEKISQNIEIESAQFSEDVEIVLDEKESLADKPETSSDEKISQNNELESAQFSEDVEIALDEKESLADRPEMSSDEKISQNIEIESAQFSEDVEIVLDEKESLADKPETSSDEKISQNNELESAKFCEDAESPVIDEKSVVNKIHNLAMNDDVLNKNLEDRNTWNELIPTMFDVEIPNYDEFTNQDASEDDIVIIEYQEEVTGSEETICDVVVDGNEEVKTVSEMQPTDVGPNEQKQCTYSEAFENLEVKGVENATEIETTEVIVENEIMPTLDKVDLEIQENHASEYGCPLLLAYEFDDVAEEVIETSNSIQESELPEEYLKKNEIVLETENKIKVDSSSVQVKVKNIKIPTKAALKEFQIPYVQLQKLPRKYEDQLKRTLKSKSSYKNLKEQKNEIIKTRSVVENVNKRDCAKSFSNALEEADRCARYITLRKRKRTQSQQEDGKKLEIRNRKSNSFESTFSSNEFEDFDKSYKHKKELAKIKINKNDKTTLLETINERNSKKSSSNKKVEFKSVELSKNEIGHKKSKSEIKIPSPSTSKEKIVEEKNILGNVGKSNKLKLKEPLLDSDVLTERKSRSKRSKTLEKPSIDEHFKSVSDSLVRKSKGDDNANNKCLKKHVEVEKIKQKTEKEITEVGKSGGSKICLSKDDYSKVQKTKSRSRSQEANIDKMKELVVDSTFVKVVEDQKLGDACLVRESGEKTDTDSTKESKELSPTILNKDIEIIAKGARKVPSLKDLNVSNKREVQYIYLNDFDSNSPKQNTKDTTVGDNNKFYSEWVSSQVTENLNELTNQTSKLKSPNINSNANSTPSKSDIENNLVEFRILKKRKALSFESTEEEALYESKFKFDSKPKRLETSVKDLKTKNCGDRIAQQVIETVHNSNAIADNPPVPNECVEEIISDKEILPLAVEEMNRQEHCDLNKVETIECEEEASLIQNKPNLSLDLDKNVENRIISGDKFVPTLGNRECKTLELETEKVAAPPAEKANLSTNTIREIPIQCESIEKSNLFDKNLPSTSKEVPISCDVFTSNPKNVQHSIIERDLIKNVPPAQILEEIVGNDNLLNCKDFEESMDAMNDDCLLQIASETIVETTRVPPSTALSDNCETTDIIQAMFSQVTQNQSSNTVFIYFKGSDHNYHSVGDPLLSAECSQSESDRSSTGIKKLPTPELYSEDNILQYITPHRSSTNIKKIPTPELDNEDNMLQYITTHSETNLNQELATGLNKTSVNNTSAFQFLDQCLIENTLGHESSPPLPQRTTCVNDFRQNLKQEVVDYEDNNSTNSSLEFVPRSNEVDLQFQQTEISTENMQELMNSVLTEIVNLNAISAMKTDVPKSNVGDCDYSNYRLKLPFPESPIKPYKDVNVGNVPLVNKSDTSANQVPTSTIDFISLNQTQSSADHSDAIASCVSKTLEFEPDFSNFYLPVIQDIFPVTNPNFKKVIVEHIVPPESKGSCKSPINSDTIKPTTTNLRTTASRPSKSNVYNPTSQLEFYKSKLQSLSKRNKNVIDSKPNLSDCLRRQSTRTPVLAPKPKSKKRESIPVSGVTKDVAVLSNEKVVQNIVRSKDPSLHVVDLECQSVRTESAVTKEIKRDVADDTLPNIQSACVVENLECRGTRTPLSVPKLRSQRKESAPPTESGVTKEIKRGVVDATVLLNKKVHQRIVTSKDQSLSTIDILEPSKPNLGDSKTLTSNKKDALLGQNSSGRPVKEVTSYLDDLNKLDVQNQSNVQPTKVRKTVDSQSQTIDITSSTETLQGKTKDFSFEQAISRNDMIDNIKCRNRKRVDYWEKPSRSPCKKPLNLHDKVPYKGNQKKVEELKGKRKVESFEDKESKLEKKSNSSSDSDKSKAGNFYDSDSSSSPRKKKPKLSLPEPSTIDAIFDRLREEGNVNENTTFTKNCDKSSKSVSLPSYDQPTSTSNNISMGNIFNTGSQRTNDNKPKQIAVVAPLYPSTVKKDTVKKDTVKKDPPYVDEEYEEYHGAKRHHPYCSNSSRTRHYPHSVREPFRPRHQESGTRRSEYQPHPSDRKYPSQSSRANKSTNNLDWLDKMKNAFPQEFNKEISFDCVDSSRSGR